MQVHQRVGDVVGRDDVDAAVGERRHDLEQPAGERAQRPVEDVERRRPAGLDSPMTMLGRAIAGDEIAGRGDELLGLALVCS